MLESKLKNWVNPIYIVCPSKWLESCVKDSFLMRNWPTSVIPNPIPTDIYRPWPKKIGRQLFKLPKEKFLILFSALDIKDDRKGYDLLLSALEILSRNSEIDFEVVVLGNYQNKTKNDFYFKQYFIDLLYDDYSIAMLYSAVDLMIVPSRMENLPQSATEAQVVVAVGFNCTGMSDAVADKSTGFLNHMMLNNYLMQLNILLIILMIKLFSKNVRKLLFRNG